QQTAGKSRGLEEHSFIRPLPKKSPPIRVPVSVLPRRRRFYAETAGRQAAATEASPFSILTHRSKVQEILSDAA
uniref:Uncharacterized protein n=1 Tax=Oryza punctata TaxID=4537 RepID=A0A0E0M9W6_ORYPU